MSYAEQDILNTLVKGIYDVETREEVLQMDLAATIIFIEARETGKRSTGVLSGGTPASGQANKATVVDKESPLVEMSGRGVVQPGTKNVLDAARRATSKKSARAKRGRTRSELTATRSEQDGNTMVLMKMTTGLANGQTRSRGAIKHAKVARKVDAKKYETPST